MLPFGGLDIPIVILYRPKRLQMICRSHDVLLSSMADNPSSMDAEHKGTISLLLLRIPEPNFAL